MSVSTNPFRRILVAYDGTPPADAALDQGLALAQQFGGDIVVVHVSGMPAAAMLPLETCSKPMNPGPQPLLDSLEPESRDVFERARARTAYSEVPASMEFSMNGTVPGILHAASRWNATAIAIGTRARTGLVHAWSGSVAESVVGTSVLPVIVAREGMGARAFRRLVVGVDCSEARSSANALAVVLGHLGPMQFTFCSVIDTYTTMGPMADMPFDPTGLLDEMRASAREAMAVAVAEANADGINPVGQVTEAVDIAAGLIRAAQEHGADAIVVGTHKRGALTRSVLGSTADSVFRRSPVPVIVVPAGATFAPPARPHAEVS